MLNDTENNTQCKPAVREVENELVTTIVEVLSLPAHVCGLDRSLSELTERTESHEGQLARLAQQTESIESRLDQILTGVEALYQQLQNLTAEAGEHRVLSEQHYEQHVIEPLVRRVLSVVDLIDGSRSLDAVCAADSGQSELLKAVRTELLALLTGYGVEPLCAEPGHPFDPRFMRPAGTRPTGDPDRDLTIAELLRTGFRRGERVLRPQSVIVYRYPHTPTTPTPTREPPHLNSEGV